MFPTVLYVLQYILGHILQYPLYNMYIAMYFAVYFVALVKEDAVDVLDVSCCCTYIVVYFTVPVVELVDVLDVSEHYVVLVGETRGDVF